MNGRNETEKGYKTLNRRGVGCVTALAGAEELNGLGYPAVAWGGAAFYI